MPRRHPRAFARLESMRVLNRASALALLAALALLTAAVVPAEPPDVPAPAPASPPALPPPETRAPPAEPVAPEPPSAPAAAPPPRVLWFHRHPRRAQAAWVAAANPLAVDAGLEILAQGGKALDAAVAVQNARARRAAELRHRRRRLPPLLRCREPQAERARGSRARARGRAARHVPRRARQALAVRRGGAQRALHRRARRDRDAVRGALEARQAAVEGSLSAGNSRRDGGLQGSRAPGVVSRRGIAVSADQRSAHDVLATRRRHRPGRRPVSQSQVRPHTRADCAPGSARAIRSSVWAYLGLRNRSPSWTVSPSGRENIMR